MKTNRVTIATILFLIKYSTTSVHVPAVSWQPIRHNLFRQMTRRIPATHKHSSVTVMQYQGDGQTELAKKIVTPDCR